MARLADLIEVLDYAEMTELALAGPRRWAAITGSPGARKRRRGR